MKINNLKLLRSFLYPHWEARTEDNRVVFIGYNTLRAKPLKRYLEICIGNKGESSPDTILRSISSYRTRIYGAKISSLSEKQLLKIIKGIRYS